MFLLKDISYYKAQVKFLFIIPFIESSLPWVGKKKKKKDECELSVVKNKFEHLQFSLDMEMSVLICLFSTLVMAADHEDALAPLYSQHIQMGTNSEQTSSAEC